MERQSYAVVDASTRAAIHRLASSGSFDVAFKQDEAIARLGRAFATPRWSELAPALGIGTQLRGLPALRAVEGLAAHQNAALIRSISSVPKMSLARVAENLRNSLAGVGGLVPKLSKELFRMPRFDREVLQGFAESARRFAEQQRAIDEHLDEFVLRHGWPIPLNLPMSTYAQIVRMADRPKREVTATMVDYFRPNGRAFRRCRETLLDHPLLESRRPLVKQVLQAQRRGHYYLVIAGLMPLVEGVLVDAIFSEVSAPEFGAVTKAVERLKEEADDVYGGVVRSVERLVVSGAAGMGLFAHTDRTTWAAEGEPRSLNRHAILHGFARRYGSAANGLKMILLLAVLAQVAE